MTTMKASVWATVPYVVADGEHTAGVSHSRECVTASHICNQAFFQRKSAMQPLSICRCSGCDAHYHQRSLAEVLCGRSRPLDITCFAILARSLSRGRPYHLFQIPVHDPLS
jgi:hypothetical protein